MRAIPVEDVDLGHVELVSPSPMSGSLLGLVLFLESDMRDIGVFPKPGPNNGPANFFIDQKRK